MSIIAFLVSTIKFGMVLLFGSTGETITEKSGHLNLGLPGVMCVGAAFGCISESFFLDMIGGKLPMMRSPLYSFLAVLIPIIATLVGGAIMGLIFSFFTVTLHANQNVTGLAMTTLGVGISKFIIASANNFKYTYAIGTKPFTTPLPFADKLGWFGELFFSYGIMVYLAIIIAVAAAIILTKTKIGLNLRAVGENPATADAAGINVARYRYFSTCIGCSISSLGGLMLIMDYYNGMWEYVIDAIGWLCVALVIFTTWKPVFGIFCSIIFGAFYVVADYIPGISIASKELFKMLPYIVTIVVLIITSIRNKKENQPPASLGLSYFREDR